MIKKNAKRLITCIELIDRAHNLIFAQTKELERHEKNGFGQLYEHYTERISINKEIVTYLQKRVSNITKTLKNA